MREIDDEWKDCQGSKEFGSMRITSMFKPSIPQPDSAHAWF